MNDAGAQPRIVESFFEHRLLYASPWVERWVIPNPFLVALTVSLKPLGVGLGDFSFKKDTATIAEDYLNIEIRRVQAAVRIALDTITFIAMNPAWEMAPELISAFELVSGEIGSVVGFSPRSQHSTLAFHVTPGESDFQELTASLVNKDIAEGSSFCGVSLYRAESTLVIDKSLRHEGAAFLRIERIFAGDTPWAEMALRLYDDEMEALRLLGISEIP